MPSNLSETQITTIYRDTVDALYAYASRKCGGERQLAEDECNTGGIELRSADTARQVGREASLTWSSDCQNYFYLDCPTYVGFGQTATCYLIASPGYYPQVVGWEFRNSTYLIYGNTYGDSWSGKMIVSGTVTVEVLTDDGFQEDAVSIFVAPRSASWAGYVGGRRGYPGEIDACFRDTLGVTAEAGFTSGQSCTSNGKEKLFTPASTHGAWFVGATIPTGPNRGLSYVSSTAVTMQLRTQLLRRYRADGSPNPVSSSPSVAQACNARFGDLNPRTFLEVNTQCFTNTQFSAFTTHVWNHEDLHMNAGVQAAKSGNGDLVKKLAEIVTDDPYNVGYLANARYFAAEAVVYNAAYNSHTHTTSTFSFYHYFASQGLWQYAQTQAKN